MTSQISVGTLEFSIHGDEGWGGPQGVETLDKGDIGQKESWNPSTPFLRVCRAETACDYLRA